MLDRRSNSIPISLNIKVCKLSEPKKDAKFRDPPALTVLTLSYVVRERKDLRYGIGKKSWRAQSVELRTY